ncbi:MAG: hypothetical protein ABI839_07300 [Verrucomicrobiota bacterium]
MSMRLFRMSLEVCPVCGYAVALVDFHCRHCSDSTQYLTSERFDAKLLLAVAAGLTVMASLVYFLFLR